MIKYEFVYISGPIAGKADRNEPAFKRAEEKLKAEGLKVINPCQQPIWGWVWSDYLRKDITLLVENCDVIYMLEGWRESKGAELEHHVAQALGMKIRYEEEEGA